MRMETAFWAHGLTDMQTHEYNEILDRHCFLCRPAEMGESGTAGRQPSSSAGSHLCGLQGTED